jgi:hypothetical protein
MMRPWFCNRRELFAIPVLLLLSVTSVAAQVITDTTTKASVKHLPTAKIDVSNDEIKIKQGDAVVIASKGTTVQSGDFLIQMAGGSGALISRNGDTVAIRNLYEDKQHSVKLVVGNRYSALSGGDELLIGPTYKDVSRLLKAEPLDRRRIKYIEIPNSLGYIRDEVSLTSLVANSKLLSDIMHSDNRDDKSIAAKLIKTAAVLSQTTRHKGSYSSLH